MPLGRGSVSGAAGEPDVETAGLEPDPGAAGPEPNVETAGLDPDAGPAGLDPDLGAAGSSGPEGGASGTLGASSAFAEPAENLRGPSEAGNESLPDRGSASPGALPPSGFAYGEAAGSYIADPNREADAHGEREPTWTRR